MFEGTWAHSHPKCVRKPSQETRNPDLSGRVHLLAGLGFLAWASVEVIGTKLFGKKRVRKEKGYELRDAFLWDLGFGPATFKLDHPTIGRREK